MNRIWPKIGCLVTGCLLLAGCDARESLDRSFRDAPLNVRDQVEEAIRLDQADSYMSAAERYDAVLHGGELTSQQESSLQAAIGQLYSRMCEAAARGDIEARQTMETIQANRRTGR